MKRVLTALVLVPILIAIIGYAPPLLLLPPGLCSICAGS